MTQKCYKKYIKHNINHTALQNFCQTRSNPISKASRFKTHLNALHNSSREYEQRLRKNYGDCACLIHSKRQEMPLSAVYLSSTSMLCLLDRYPPLTLGNIYNPTDNCKKHT